MIQIDPMECQHNWAYGGIVWKREINSYTRYNEYVYYDLYYCTKCLSFRLIPLNERHSSDLTPKEGTRPYYYQ